jgi:hypothetical protein
MHLGVIALALLDTTEGKLAVLMLGLVVFASAFALWDRASSRRTKPPKPRRSQPDPGWEEEPQPKEIYTPRPYALGSPATPPPPPTRPAEPLPTPGQGPPMAPPPQPGPTPGLGGVAPALPPIQSEPPGPYPLPFSTLPSDREAARGTPPSDPSDLGLDLPPVPDGAPAGPAGHPDLDPATGLPVFKPRGQP